MVTKRVLGIDRSGPPPAATQSGAPLRPFTLPNLVTVIRLALIPVFLVLVLGTDDGRSLTATAVFAVAAGSDFLDGVLARSTGQYSRLGSLLDPLVDRLLVISAVVVSWHFDLLPRWGLAVLVVREVVIVSIALFGLARGLSLGVNWAGRLALTLVMFAFGGAMLFESPMTSWMFIAGVVLSLFSLVEYVYSGIKTVRRGTEPW